MLTIISPAKSLDFDSKVATKKHSNPQFLPEASELMGSLRKLSPAKISSLMSISDKLAMKTFKGLMSGKLLSNWTIQGKLSLPLRATYTWA